MDVLRNKKAQSTAEYAIIIGVVVAVAVGMQTYIKRGLQGRSRDAALGYTAAVSSNADLGTLGVTATMATDGQYEVTEIASHSTQNTLADTENTTMAVGGAVTKTSGRSTSQQLGDFQEHTGVTIP